jgi:outer membrane protein assembly factor BamB
MNAGSVAPPGEERASSIDIPFGAFFFSLSALFSYGIFAGLAVVHMDYWPRRYVIIHVVLLGIAYLAVAIFAVVPSLRSYVGAIGVGVAIASFFALNLNGGLDPIGILIELLGVGMGSVRNGESASMALFIGGFILSNILLARASALRARSSTPRRSLLIVAAAFYCIGTGPITDAINRYESAKVRKAREQAQGVPSRIYGVQACLVRYAHTNSQGSYPGSLRDANSLVPGCLDPALAAGGTIDGFRYRYAPSDGSTGNQHFDVVADSIYSVGRMHITFFSDETFILRETEDSNVSPPKGRGYVPSSRFNLFVGGIGNYTVLERGRNAWEKSHSNAVSATLNSSELHYPETLVDSQPPGYFPQSSAPHDANSFSDRAYIYRYEKVAGPPENFRLSMRPTRYGVSGVFSFYVDNAGIVHSTPEDRPATPQDPQAEACAYGAPSSGCAAVASTGSVDPSKLFPGSTLDPRLVASHPGGLAKDSAPTLFWQVNNKMPQFLGVSEDSQLLYATSALTGLSALRTSDALPVWRYPGGVNGAVGPDALYALSSSNGEDLLVRIDPVGEILWRFSVSGAKSLVRAHDGTLFVPGSYLWAINEKGEQLWRMHLADYGADLPALSADEKTLYLVSTTRLYAIDTGRGALRWSVSNPCYSLFRECTPRVLSDGRVAIESVSDRSGKAGSSGVEYQVRVVDADGKEVWSRDAKSTIEYVVPPGTSLLVVRYYNGLEILDASGMRRRTEPGNWFNLSVAQQPGVFFACSSEGLTGFESDGRRVLNIPGERLGGMLCGPAHAGPGKLLFVESMDMPHEQYSLWSLLFP